MRFQGDTQCNVWSLNDRLVFGVRIGLNVIDGRLWRLLEGYSSFKDFGEKLAAWQWLESVQGLQASLSVSGEMLNVASTLMSASEMGLFFIDSATTKAAVQGYQHKAASICFAVMSACLPLSF